MSQQISQPQEDPIYNEIRSILKPMINTALTEMPKDPVINLFFYLFIFIVIDSFYDSMVTKLFRYRNTWRKF